jgi:tetratricopeptide (TPR) repeat protein
VEALYGAGPKPRRDTLFANAMERVTVAFPKDDEAKVFFALALLGLNQADRETVAYMRAGAIAEDVLRRNPQHPGAAHFIIHAFDDPTHAPLGLWAARAYSKIAPQAPHAQHMTTHIFLAMGMWDDVVSQNVIAAGPDRDHWQAGHYTVWLEYGYLQQGRYATAREHANLLRTHAGSNLPPGTRPSLVNVRAAYLFTTERWSDPVSEWSLGPYASPMIQSIEAFTTGYAMLKRGDRARAETHPAAIDAADKNGAGGPQSDPRVVHIIALEMRAALAAASGRSDTAIAIIREAARLEDALPVEFGPPLIPKPAHELAGEILLAAGHSAEAQREFARAEEAAPGRSRALIGLARAASRAGDASVAAQAARKLLDNWHGADADVPEREEMQRIASARR